MEPHIVIGQSEQNVFRVFALLERQVQILVNSIAHIWLGTNGTS